MSLACLIKHWCFAHGLRFQFFIIPVVEKDQCWVGLEGVRWLALCLVWWDLGRLGFGPAWACPPPAYPSNAMPTSRTRLSLTCGFLDFLNDSSSDQVTVDMSSSLRNFRDGCSKGMRMLPHLASLAVSVHSAGFSSGLLPTWTRTGHSDRVW